MAASDMKLSLKLMVDSNTQKVVFAEAGKEFVDFLIHILSLPLATVVKLLNNQEIPGSLPSLYKSIESLETEFFDQNVNKATILQPKLPIPLPLLSLSNIPATSTYYKCPSHSYVSDQRGALCPQTFCNGRLMNEVKFVNSGQTSRNEIRGFVTKAVVYMVMDNLEVMPMSVCHIKSLDIDFNSLVKEEVEFGIKEGLELLRASLATNDVLTTVFVGTRKKINRQVQRIQKSFSRAFYDVLMFGARMYFGCLYGCIKCMTDDD